MTEAAHYLAQVEIAYAAFVAHGLAKVSKKDRTFIHANVSDHRNAVADGAFDLDAAVAFFQYMAKRTKAAARTGITYYEDVAEPTPAALDVLSADLVKIVDGSFAVAAYLGADRVAYHRGVDGYLGFSRRAGERLVARVNAARRIDPALWVVREIRAV